MLLQNETLPFDTPIQMILFWIITLILGFIFLDAKLLKKKVIIPVYLFTIFYAGIILFGIPNVSIPLDNTLTAISERGDLSYLLHAYAVVGILLGSSFLFSRIFCGFACPLGALQEVLSRINFKSDIKSQQKNKFHFEVSTSVTTKIRWIFLVLLFLSSSVLSLAILPFFNPFSGFSYLQSFEIIVLVPFISLLIIGILSIFLYRPWCRFLCPFGAGAGFLGKFSTVKYRRTDACTDCGLCEEVCPTQEAAADSRKGECYYCNRCIEICPHDAITFDIPS